MICGFCGMWAVIFCVIVTLWQCHGGCGYTQEHSLAQYGGDHRSLGYSCVLHVVLPSMLGGGEREKRWGGGVWEVEQDEKTEKCFLFQLVWVPQSQLADNMLHHSHYIIIIRCTKNITMLMGNAKTNGWPQHCDHVYKHDHSTSFLSCSLMFTHVHSCSLMLTKALP